jgi:hypothetical protein
MITVTNVYFVAMCYVKSQCMKIDSKGTNTSNDENRRYDQKDCLKRLIAKSKCQRSC